MSSGGEEEFKSVTGEYTLFHGKSVFVETTLDSEDIALVFITKTICFNFLTHSLLEEDSASVVIIDLERFSSAVGGERNAELHYDRLTFISVTK